MEEWRDVVDYPGYKVSSFGNVIGKFGRQLKPWDNCRGYHSVWICNERGKRKITVHKIVAMTFLPNPENKPTIDHLNRNRKDNRVENLNWATHSEQRLTSPVPISLTGERNINTTANGKFRFVIKRNRTTLVNEIYDTFEEAMEAKNKFVGEK
jgi:hypothetical protein